MARTGPASVLKVVVRLRTSKRLASDLKICLIDTGGFTIYDLRFTIYDLQFTIYDLRFTIYDLQFTIYEFGEFYDLRIFVYFWGGGWWCLAGG